MAESLQLNRSYFFTIKTRMGYDDYASSKKKDRTLKYDYQLRIEGKDFTIPFESVEGARETFIVDIPEDLEDELNKDRESSERILATIQDAVNNFCSVEDIDLGSQDIGIVTIILKYGENEKRKKLYEHFYDRVKIPNDFKKGRLGDRPALKHLRIKFQRKAFWDE